MSDVQIRKAAEADQGIIRQMVRDEGLDRTALEWSHFLVADEDGEIVGIGQIRPYPKCRELGSLVVKAEYRKQGVGEMLVKALLAGERGDVYLECLTHNERFYSKFGFERIAWWKAPMPLRLKTGIGQIGRLFGYQVIAMKLRRNTT